MTTTPLPAKTWQDLPAARRVTPAQMLRALRHRPGLAALTGDWDGGATIIAFDPVRVLGPQEDPFAVLAEPGAAELASAAPPGSGGAFCGGWIGYLGYQLAGTLEHLPTAPPAPTPLPRAHLGYYEVVLRHDTSTGRWRLVSLPGADPQLLDVARAVVTAATEDPDPGPASYRCGPFGTDTADHARLVAAAREHVHAGDVFQVNVCRRLSAPFDGDPLDLFLAGQQVLRPRFAAFLRLPDGAVASLSPELFLRRRGREVLSSPIKGTAPLAEDPAALAASGKNRAENVMIVDLMRNDLGRVAEPGSVRVSDLARVEPHTGVHHLVSDVRATVRDGLDDGDLLRATFPPGSCTGAPKVRAMELIHRLERSAREVYTGAVGLAGPGAGLVLNVAIRTFEFAAGRVWLGVGGGVVAGSDPEAETHETLVKAAPLLAAVGGELDEELQAQQGRTTAARERAAAKSPPPRPASPRLAAAAPAPAAPAPPRRAPDPALGVFTTLVVRDGTAPDLDRHLARLRESAQECYARPLPTDLGAEIAAAAARLAGAHRLRVDLTPSAYGFAVTLSGVPLAPGPPPAWSLHPVVLPGGWGAHKWVDRRGLEVPAAGPGPGADVLVTDVDGTVLEAGRGNLFAVAAGAVHTAPTDGRLLPGTARARTLAALHHAGIPVHERRLTTADLAEAEELFITNAVVGAAPVTAVAGVGRWRAGALTRWLQQRLAGPADRSGTGPAPVVTELVGGPGDRPRPGRRGPARLGPARRGPARRRPRLLLVDNYDSFVYNLDQQVRGLGARTTVVRNDAVDIDDLRAAAVAGDLDGVIISPGPGRPVDAGRSPAVVRVLGPLVPVLGVCLGHQCIGEVYGARVVRAPQVVHGSASMVHHEGTGVFTGLDAPLSAGRYHSLVLDPASLPGELEVTARTSEGTVMGVRHRDHPVEGVQFHPESLLSPRGRQVMATFLGRCG